MSRVFFLFLLIISTLCYHKRTIAEEIASASESLEEATFAGGCFWCVEADFDKLNGVVETISGYTGGHTLNPTYESVGTHQTGHVEAVRVRFDPKRVSYEKLLDYYWHHVDFLDGEGQFCDRGNTYRPIIFTHTPAQEKAAHKSLTELQTIFGKEAKITVTLKPQAPFTAAEAYHQDYYKKNPIKYTFYRRSCGRDARIQELWARAHPHGPS